LRARQPERKRLLAETDLSLAQIALRSGFSDQSHFSPVEKLDRVAQANYGKPVIHLGLRWLLDRPGVGVALWGARHPDQLRPLADVMRWRIDADAMVEIDRILETSIADSIGPEFMAPPVRDVA
jgi:aryl-alcohol dehydrogenase-like predicted oxidoreductase